MHCGASICLGANVNVNANAAIGSLHEPIGVNANLKCNRVTRNFEVPSQIWSKNDRPHATNAFTLCMPRAAYMES